MILNIQPPSDTQKRFLRADTKHVGFGGARGGGKSWSVRTKAKLLALKYAGIRILIVRRTYPELINNHINILRTELLGVARYNDKDKVLKFNNGSSINFSYCDSDKDLDRQQGVEYDVIFFDEATQLSEYQMKTLTACLRGVNDFPKRVYYTCNPGGQGHSYIKRIFIDRLYEDGEDPTAYTFIQSKVTDNTALMEADPEYLKQLEALPPKLRKAWLEGSWDVFMGQFFEEFTNDPSHYQDRLWTHVIDPFEVPDSWEIHRSFDWGYAKPFSCDWWAVDGENRAYLILQLYGCNGTPNEGLKWSADKVFSEIARIEREHRWLKGKYIRGVADSAIWAADGGEAIIEAADRHQVYFEKSDKHRIPGWMQMHYRLAFDERGRPMMQFFNTCKHAIRTLPLLQYSEHQPEDLDTEGEDHFADSCRYFCMMRPISARIGEKKSKPYFDPLDQFSETNNSTYRSYGR